MLVRCVERGVGMMDMLRIWVDAAGSQFRLVLGLGQLFIIRPDYIMRVIDYKLVN